jgi:putative photosynthetic complex assembly protein
VQWFADSGSDTVPEASVLQMKSLYFEDQPAGEVAVIDADSGEQIALLLVGEHGFIRSTLRGLVRARRARGIGAESPFILEQRDNGQLLLSDPVTGTQVDLWAFGSVNAQSFSDFLTSDSLSGAKQLARTTGTSTARSGEVASPLAGSTQHD